MGPILPPTNLDVLLLMGRVPGSSGVAASRYEFILIYLCHRQIELTMALEAANCYSLSLVGDVQAPQ